MHLTRIDRVVTTTAVLVAVGLAMAGCTSSDPGAAGASGSPSTGGASASAGAPSTDAPGSDAATSPPTSSGSPAPTGDAAQPDPAPATPGSSPSDAAAAPTDNGAPAAFGGFDTAAVTTACLAALVANDPSDPDTYARHASTAFDDASDTDVPGTDLVETLTFDPADGVAFSVVWYCGVGGDPGSPAVSFVSSARL